MGSIGAIHSLGARGQAACSLGQLTSLGVGGRCAADLHLEPLQLLRLALVVQHLRLEAARQTTARQVVEHCCVPPPAPPRARPGTPAPLASHLARSKLDRSAPVGPDHEALPARRRRRRLPAETWDAVGQVRVGTERRAAHSSHAHSAHTPVAGPARAPTGGAKSGGRLCRRRCCCPSSRPGRHAGNRLRHAHSRCGAGHGFCEEREARAVGRLEDGWEESWWIRRCETHSDVTMQAKNWACSRRLGMLMPAGAAAAVAAAHEARERLAELLAFLAQVLCAALTAPATPAWWKAQAEHQPGAQQKRGADGVRRRCGGRCSSDRRPLPSVMVPAHGSVRSQTVGRPVKVYLGSIRPGMWHLPHGMCTAGPPDMPPLLGRPSYSSILVPVWPHRISISLLPTKS